jgi:hypothetical protein
MQKQKRPFILFELMIALVLTAILLSVLLRFFINCVMIDKKIDTARRALHSYQQLEMRLSSLFTSLVPSSTLPHPVPCFYTIDEPALIAVYDNGIDPDPAFSGPILAKLFLDQDNLAILLWPLEKKEREITRKEILLAHVSGFEFEFLTPKHSSPLDPHAKSINDTMEWRTNWPKEDQAFPSVIRIRIHQDGRDLPFAFHLAKREPILFQQPVGSS